MSGKSRTLGRALRQAARLDHKGTRWLMQLLTPPPTVVVLHNRGRNSGKLYRTPLSILQEDRQAQEIVVTPMFGADTDWYQNVLAGGLVSVSVRGETWQADWRELDDAEKDIARAAFRAAYPRYSGIITRRVTRLQSAPAATNDEAVGVSTPTPSLPMLGLRRQGLNDSFHI